MFLGNLSATTERKARKPKAEKSGASDNQDGNPSVTDDIASVGQVRRLARGEKPILYTKDSPVIPRELLLEYFKVCAAMLNDDKNVREVINEAISKRMGLHQMEVEFQRDVLENNFQIERDYGCQYLGTIPQRFPEDQELIEGAQNFMLGCMRGYLKALKTRAKLFKSGAISGPLPNENMTRTAILEFFEACNALMGMPETRKELRDIFLETKNVPNERVIEMQRNILKQLGYHPDFAVSCLNRIGQDFRDDREIMTKMQFFAVGAEVSCHIATLDEADLAHFMSQVPPLLRHCPQVHVLQQRMMAHQQAQIQQQMAGQAATQISSEQRALDTKALQNSGMLAFLSTPEGRTQLQAMAAKVGDSRQRVEAEMATWDTEKKTDFFTSFQAHPVLAALSQPKDPLEKMQVILSFSDADLDAAMKMIVMLTQDESGTMMNELRKKAADVASGTPSLGDAEDGTSQPAVAAAAAAAAAEPQEEKARSQALHSMVAALSSLDNMKRMQQMRAAAGANAPHGHPGHQHSAACSHGAPGMIPQSDVSRSGGISMER